ncbi:MAG: UDP-N-acetylmuramoyl-L-alanine--D-glutamate ligase [Clostridiales bacterium]|nr:UDP-N-acetylmuramoyl-L-alanine--D-glutamate ligase [Clostridiales bacterium]
MELKQKKALVCGMARSGVCAARLLNRHGAVVTLQDKKPREALTGLEELEREGIQIYCGKNPDDIVLQQDLIVLSPGIPCDLPFITAAEKAGIEVISEVELSYRLSVCHLAAVTGTNGKTTTTTLLWEMIKKIDPQAAAVGNIGVAFSQEVERLQEENWAVAEISSFQMEKAVSFHPEISAVLNITPDHLNRHKTMDVYIAMKERIFQNQTEQDFCVLNYEDEVCRKMAGKTKAQVLFFSSQRQLEEGIFLQNGNIVMKWGPWNETLVHVEEMKILGSHNYENAMAAAAMAFAAGVPAEEIRQTLREFAGVAHRIEYVTTKSGVSFYNDSKGTNPDAAIRAVYAMKQPIVLIGGGYDKGSSYEEWIKTFPGRVKKLVLIGVTAEKIRDTAVKMGFTNITMCGNDFSKAVEESYRFAEAGDCVLLSPACASWDMFESYEKRGDLFKELVRALPEKED